MKWEYYNVVIVETPSNRLTSQRDEIERQFDDLGELGWELVTGFSSTATGSNQTMFTFKREISYGKGKG